MFNSKGNLNNLMEQAKQMQEKMQKFQEEIVKFRVTGESGAGIVKVTIDGSFNCCQIKIDHSVFEDDKEVLEDLLVAAFNDAVRRVEEIKKEKIVSVSKGMQLPIDLKALF